MSAFTSLTAARTREQSPPKRDDSLDPAAGCIGIALAIAWVAWVVVIAML